LLEGLITKINTSTFTVKVKDGYIDCQTRGILRYNKVSPLVGDKVIINEDKKVIESIITRKNSLDRPPVANIDIALIVTSLVKPNINLTLLDKLISIITINNIEPVIVLTKIDLASKENINDIENIINYYEDIGIRVFINNDINSIKKYLKNKIVTVCGQTGAGKSTLINKLDNKLDLETKEISDALGRGVHTTRIVSLYEIDDFYIVDTPGFSAIDISKYSLEEIKNSFREFRNSNCQFRDCKHEKEMGCNIIKDVNFGKILKSRYDNYLQFIKELK
jgi:ribosome biogenesis GTPase